MSRWFRFDCDAVRHPKVLELSDTEFRVWVECIAYAAEHGTDGRITQALFNRLRVPAESVQHLVRVGLLEHVEDGYALHDYLDHQPPAEHWDRMADRAKKAANARWKKPLDKPNNATSIAPSIACSNATNTNTNTDTESLAPKSAPELSEKSAKRTKSETRKTAKAAQRDDAWRDLFGALVESCDGERPATRAEQGKYATACDELRRIGATADDVRARSREYRKRYGAVSLTPPALVRNWSSVAPSPSALGASSFGNVHVIGGAA